MQILCIDNFVNFSVFYFVFDYCYRLEDLLSFFFALVVREKLQNLSEESQSASFERSVSI